MTEKESDQEKREHTEQKYIFWDDMWNESYENHTESD